MNHSLYIIVATEEHSGIGKSGVMPWDLKNDLRHFQKITTETRDPKKQNMLIMGRTTWFSIPEKHRPFKNRKNVVLTRTPDETIPAKLQAHSFDEAFAMADDSIESVFVIGGGSVYAAAIHLPQLTGVYLTKIHQTFDCDTFFPNIPDTFNKPTVLGDGEENGIRYEFLLYERPLK